MMNRRSTLRLPLLALALLSASAGCDALLELSGGYTGPPPAREALNAETATIAGIFTTPSGQVDLVLDRVRFVQAGRPHDVNRVIRASTLPENQAQIAALELRKGERIVLSTEFLNFTEGGGSMGVSNWPGHDAMEYPIGWHRIKEIARAAP